MIAVFSFAAVSCIDEIGNTDIPTAETGDEVQFGLSLPDAKTRTVYGNESDNAFPIYWADGDKVQIFSPQASEGRNNAEYRVALPSGVEKPNYAYDLVKTGSYGLQWGEGYTYTDTDDNNTKHEGVHDFYSIYPSGQYDFDEDDSDGSIWAKNVQISATQNIDYLNSGLAFSMNNCVMYAKTQKVEMGQVVNLNYKPLSTVLWVSFTADAQANTQETLRKGFQIFGVTLEAAEAYTISGTFDVNVSNEEFIVVDGSNKINVVIYDKSSGQEVTYTLPAGGTMSFPIFLAPGDMDIKGWKITVNTDQGSFTKTLATDGEKLKAGQIHKIALPTLKLDTKDWDVSQWMTYIPRNVYLSEVSIPGSWNSLNSDFQGNNPSIATQYAAGVRAFHLDTRWTTTLKAGGALFADDFYKVGDLNSDNMYLSVADGNGGSHVRSGSSVLSSSLGQVMKQNNTSFVDYLEQVTKNVTSNEYMVLFCSFAQGSYNDPAKSGKTWMQAISDACDDNDRVYDASNINSNTVVGDVLNSVIVIVNCENPIASETLPTDSKCIFVHIPNQLTVDYFPTTGFMTDNLHTTSTSTSPISMAVSQAQVTSSTGAAIADGVRGYYPSFDQRTGVVNNILDWSKANYSASNYSHDKWIYLGLGGSTANSKNDEGDDGTSDDVAAVYSPLIDSRINAMGKNDIPFYPVGIVYMNLTTSETLTVGNTTFSPKQTVKNILLLNNKYRLQYDPNKSVDYGGDFVGNTEGELD